MAVEVGSVGDRKVSEKASDPRSEMLLEDLALPLDWRRKLSPDETRHDFAQNGRVVFGFTLPLDAFDAESPQILAQARQRALVEKSGQVVRTVGQKLAAPDADEEVEKLARDRFGDPSGRGLGQRCMRNTKRRCIPVKLGDASEQHRIRRTCQQ